MQFKIIFLISSFLFFSASSLADNPIILDGHHLTLSQVVDIARNGTEVIIASDAYKKVVRSYQTLLLAGQKNFPIYGLNHGVGQNKDKHIFHGSIIDPKAKALSEEFISVG